MGRTLYLVHQVLPTMPGLGRPALMLPLHCSRRHNAERHVRTARAA